MIPNEAAVEGTLNPDGTLDLDQKPNLPPGRVKVLLRQEEPAPKPVENWWQFLQRSHRELEAAGAHFMNDAEVEAHINWLREADPTDKRLH